MAHNKNKGFSLIELIVTIAILAIVTGSAIGIFGMLKKGYFNEAYKGTTAFLSDLRSDTMSKSNEIYGDIYKDSSGYHAEVVKVTTTPSPTGGVSYSYKVLSTTSLGKKAKIYSVDKASGNKTEITASSGHIMIKYNRSNGTFSSKMLGTINPRTNAIIGNEISAIHVEYSTLSKTIKLIETGKYKADK